MGWLHERGLISSYEDYLSLPAGVLEDARLVMAAESRKQQQEEQKRRHRA